MFIWNSKKNHNDPLDDPDILIGLKTVLTTNELKCFGTIHIDGQLHGAIDVNGDLSLGKDGCINGDINAVNIKIGGTVIGNVSCEKGTLYVSSTGAIDGDVKAGNICVDEGACISGKCSVGIKTKNEFNFIPITKKSE